MSADSTASVPAVDPAVRGTLYQFPLGIPAFEHVTRFHLVENPAFAPLVVLQGDCEPAVQFACVPVHWLMPDYRLELSEEETALLDASGAQGQLILLAVVTFREGRPPTANLLAPVVLNPGARIGVQSIQAHLPYSHLHPLRQETSCS